VICLFSFGYSCTSYSSSPMTDMSDQELLAELFSRGLVTTANHHSKIKKDLDDGLLYNFKVIITHGGPTEGEAKCTRCHDVFPVQEFPLYQGRVNKNGYLMFSNKVCKKCTKESSDELYSATSALNLTKPEKGSTCSRCNRSWDGAWHRHHNGDSFLGWLCNLCNMSLHDHKLDNSPEPLDARDL